MSGQLATIEPPVSDGYEAIEAAVMETARGRAFLLEYARRVRAAETAQVLEALGRIEGRLRAPAAPDAQADLADALATVERRLSAIAADARARGADARTIFDIEMQARALRRLLAGKSPAPPAAAMAPAPAPLRAPPPPRADVASAFATIDALDARARGVLFT